MNLTRSLAPVLVLLVRFPFTVNVFDFSSLIVHTCTLVPKRASTRELTCSSKFHETIFENLEAHEKRLSFIFHLFVKWLINISDVRLATVLKLC